MLKRSEHAGGKVVRYRMARTLLGKPLYIGSCYRLGRVLIDAGTPNNVHELRAALARDDAKLHTVLVTHGHEDHAGNVGAFPGARHLGAEGTRISRNIPFYRKVTWGEPGPGSLEPLRGAIEEQGLRIEPFPTPGHTADHLAYWVPERRWLFAGDAALGPVKYSMRGEHVAGYVASLQRMLDLKPSVVFPAHGPVMNDPSAQLRAQLDHFRRLRAAVHELAAQGWSDAAITHKLLGFNGPMSTYSGGEFSKRRLVEGLREMP